jgi:hypothetical protein
MWVTAYNVAHRAHFLHALVGLLHYSSVSPADAASPHGRLDRGERAQKKQGSHTGGQQQVTALAGLLEALLVQAFSSSSSANKPFVAMTAARVAILTLHAYATLSLRNGVRALHCFVRAAGQQTLLGGA